MMAHAVPSGEWRGRLHAPLSGGCRCPRCYRAERARRAPCPTRFARGLSLAARGCPRPHCGRPSPLAALSPSASRPGAPRRLPSPVLAAPSGGRFSARLLAAPALAAGGLGGWGASLPPSPAPRLPPFPRLLFLPGSLTRSLLLSYPSVLPCYLHLRRFSHRPAVIRRCRATSSFFGFVCSGLPPVLLVFARPRSRAHPCHRPLGGTVCALARLWRKSPGAPLPQAPRGRGPNSPLALAVGHAAQARHRQHRRHVVAAASAHWYATLWRDFLIGYVRRPSFRSRSRRARPVARQFLTRHRTDTRRGSHFMTAHYYALPPTVAVGAFRTDVSPCDTP